jgi:hypothetical protein
MPTVLIIDGYRFFFYSNEGNEPRHIHVEKGDATAKYWLDEIEEVYTFDFKPKESKRIRSIIVDYQDFF